MNINDLTLGQINQLKNLFKDGHPETQQAHLGWNIVILQRGWVVVGNLFKTGPRYTLEDGAVIRTWGTTRGLGEIASNGPTEKTILDPIPTTTFHELTMVACMACNKRLWEKPIK